MNVQRPDPLRIDLHYGQAPPFGPLTHQMSGIGGTENFITNVAEYLARAGHIVCVYNQSDQPQIVEYAGGAKAWWRPLLHFSAPVDRDVLVSFRMRDVFQLGLSNTKLKVLILADTESHGLGDDVREGRIDQAMAVGAWQAEKIGAEEGIELFQASNGVAMEKFNADRGQIERVPGKCIHLSTPERGLEALLDVWPEIQKRVPHANLHLFSSFKGWGVSEYDNRAMSAGLYDRILAMQADGARIENHIHVNEAGMRRHMFEAELMLYPTRHFNETCCISALESSAAGLPIVATARAALRERVKHGVTGYLVAEGDAHDSIFASWVEALLIDAGRWESLSAASVRMAKEYDYARLVPTWAEMWRDAIAIRR